MARQGPFRDPSRRTTDADSHFVVPEIDTFAKIEGGRIAEPYHLSIATDQLRSEFVRRKRKQLVPFPHERPACELIGLVRVRDLGLFDQRRIATDLPRNEPMHNQLRGVANNSLIDFDCHGKIHYSVLLARRKQASSPDWSNKDTLLDALEGGRSNTKGRIAYLGGAHAVGPLLAQSGRRPKP
jgi:hypothetical protein